MPISGEVAIIGTGTIKFGENFHQSYNDMLWEACREAFSDARLDPADIQAGWLGTYLPFSWGYEGASGVNVTETLKMEPIPVTRVSNYCSTGMEAVRNGAFAVAAGEYDLVLAVGVEKMRDVSGRGSLVAQHVERGHPLYCKGRTAPGMFALLANRYFHEYGIGEDTLAKVAVKNHKHGSLNPKAHFRSEINIEKAMSAPPVVSPLKLFDCCPTTDGAAAAILCPAHKAKEYTDDYVIIKGAALAITGGYYTAQMHPAFSFTGFESTQEAARKAYAQAGIKKPIAEVDVVELHDCFTITEIVNYEDLLFAEKGEGWKLIEEGETYLDGKLPVNTSGGLKSCGHPVGASGVRMINNISDQLRGRADKMQVKKANLGVAHTLGGPGALASVFVLGAP
ncbi:MAG: acetyl-CoA acetyltransferase [bacterium]